MSALIAHIYNSKSIPAWATWQHEQIIVRNTLEVSGQIFKVDPDRSGHVNIVSKQTLITNANIGASSARSLQLVHIRTLVRSVQIETAHSRLHAAAAGGDDYTMPPPGLITHAFALLWNCELILKGNIKA